MVRLPATSSRLKWGGAIVVTALLAVLVAVGGWLANGSDNPVGPSVDPGRVAGTPTVPDHPPSTPPAVPTVRDSATPDASPVTIVGATPYTVDKAGAPDGACAAGCLVRLPLADDVHQILGDAGERPSFEGGDWMWAVVSRQTVDRLEGEEIPVYLVQDSPETLYLYVTRLPEGHTWNGAVESLGEVLDSVSGQSIVRASAIPPIVTGIVEEGIWIEKLKPSALGVTEHQPAGTGESLAERDLGELLPQVDVDNVWQTVVDLQGMSSTDGSGIGTRQYTRPGNVMAAEYLFTQLESYGLDVWYEDFITWEGYLSSNVVGEIPGRDETMIYGVMAHLDSTAASFDEAPGADDNASGVAGALEIARILAGYELQHPVHIVFVNAEETAIIGSMAYADGIVQNVTPIEGIFNLDTIANPVYGTRLILNSGPKSAWMVDLLIRINDGYGLGQNIMALQTDSIVSDDTMLRRRGIESVLIARLLADDYGVHHSANDTIDVMSFDHTVSATQLVLLAIAALVQ